MGVNIEKVFGENVFDDAVMKVRLPKSDYETVKKLMYEGGEITEDLADVVAQAMKEWALEKGATHFTHVFQPYVISVGAEKHDSFASVPIDGKIENTFTGKDLLMGEPDASSFPSGGLRATCGARGYTAWDITSPVYVKEDTLCIPTAFCSYTGESLDTKTPLLKAMHAVSKQGVRLMRLFGDQDTKRIFSYVGPEQEYFLVDREKYLKRPDLMYSGRTLFGAMPPKGQEMDDHYFGAIKPRVKAFMEDINVQLWKLGITAKTEHNEVAPAQHELAPIYDTTNIATDHNQLIMEIMKKVALRHNLVCLLHEKPFAGINGSGKHNNWSMSTDTGKNLLEPGDTPHSNKQFLLVLASILKAVDDAPLLRMSAATPGNDHRLGANEAPPAIISVFLGDQLEDVLSQLCEKGEATRSLEGSQLETGVSTVPRFSKDATDRNRTSPFAFTGNKFEFRMVGSSASIADPNIVLNTIVAETLCQAADILEKADDFELALHDLIKDWVTDHIRIIFNGDGYSDAWVEEAARRGLPNIKNTVDATSVLADPEVIKLFDKHGVFSAVELAAREEVGYENYSKAINIEARTMIDMVKKEIIPAVMEYTTTVAKSVAAVKAVGADASVQEKVLKEITTELSKLDAAVVKLEAATDASVKIEDPKAQAIAYRDDVFAQFAEVREPADKLETLLDEKAWPFPTYAELLFNV